MLQLPGTWVLLVALPIEKGNSSPRNLGAVGGTAHAERRAIQLPGTWVLLVALPIEKGNSSPRNLGAVGGTAHAERRAIQLHCP